MFQMRDFVRHKIVYDIAGRQRHPPVVVYIIKSGAAAPARLGVFYADTVDFAADLRGQRRR